MPGTRCTVCDHPDRKAIDAALPVSSGRNIARRWGVSPAAVHRHKVRHAQPAVARAIATRTELSAQALLDRLQGLLDRCDANMTKAEANSDYKATAGLIREARELCVTIGRASHGLWTQKPSIIDNRKQTLVFEGMETGDLREFVRRVIGGGDPASSEPSLRQPRAALSSDAHGELLEAP